MSLPTELSVPCLAEHTSPPIVLNKAIIKWVQTGGNLFPGLGSSAAERGFSPLVSFLEPLVGLGTAVLQYSHIKKVFRA